MKEAGMGEELRWVGKPVPRKDGAGKVTGETKFFSDMVLPNMLWAKVVRSKYPHALIRKINTTKAEAVPGVVTVLTHRDVPGLNAFGILMADQPALCYDKVRCLGDSLAVVAAESKDVAETAAELVEVDYEPLPVVSDPLEAMKPDAPRVHEKGNVHRHATIRVGDFEEAFRNASVAVENTFRTGRQMHMFLEPEAGIGMLDDKGNIVLYVGGQSPYRDQMQVSRALSIEPERVRVISTPVGGAFGGKEENTVQIQLALLALKTKRPVKMVWSREESGMAGTKRHPMIVTMKTAANKDGELQANKVRIVADTGAYLSLGPTVLDVAIENSCGPYRVPNIDIEAYLVYTNNGVAGAFRGFGAPQVNFAMETNLDMIAEKRRNLRDPSQGRERGYLEKSLKTQISSVASLDQTRSRSRSRGQRIRLWCSPGFRSRINTDHPCRKIRGRGKLSRNRTGSDNGLFTNRSRSTRL
jgi:CO/xanthine dehydrogenase Mo-binding subunit